MTISAIRLEQFTAFQKNMIDFSSGLNVLIGANGTGKTSNHATHLESVTVTGATEWGQSPIESVYIPIKEMLSKDEEFFLRNKQGNLEFSLLAEGVRKLALIWLLIQNGTLLEGSVLFWDEPETNLNPKLFSPLIQILLDLQRSGVQVFLATHDYLILKEIDLYRQQGDEISFHSLFTSPETEGIACHTTSDYNGIHPNAIADAFSSVYDREIKRSLAGLQV